MTDKIKQITVKESIKIRQAKYNDVPHIVRLFSQDQLGKQRELYQEPLPQSYYDAFSEIEADKNNYLIVMEMDTKIIGTLQLTIIPNLTRQGSKRALIEGVHINDAYQGLGLGKKLMEWAIEKAREMGCYLVQLTTDKSRKPSAVEFYKKLGFVDSHEGLKLKL